MPIAVPAGVRTIEEEAFHEIDYQVMGLAFNMRNELGRLWDENIYQNELAFRCQQAGLPGVSTEVPIHVSFRTFTKTYCMDLLVAGGAMFELKTTSALTERHWTQAIQYLLLAGLSHGALVNLRPASVQHRFVSTRLTPEKRRAYTVDDAQWQDSDAESLWLKQFVLDLLCDWGAFLAADLYCEAVEHFRGGPHSVVHQVDIVNGPRVMGSQQLHLLNPATAFRITTLTREQASYEQHLRKMLAHTRLRRVQWVNLNHHAITLKTLTQ
jgi:GxxExxY protein